MVVKDSPEDTVLEDLCRCDLPECHGGGMADQEEDASSRSIRRSSRTIQHPPRFTEAEEDPASMYIDVFHSRHNPNWTIPVI